MAKTNEEWAALLSERIGLTQVKAYGLELRGSEHTLYNLARNPDPRVAYNALWICTHYPASQKWRFQPYRQRFADLVLITEHTGCLRLLLTLLESLRWSATDFRSDYFDFCIDNILSNGPYAVRALSMKQAFSHGRFSADLMHELSTILEMMNESLLTPGLRSARRIVLRRIARLLQPKPKRKSTRTEPGKSH